MDRAYVILGVLCTLALGLLTVCGFAQTGTAPVPAATIGAPVINADLIRVGISSNDMKDQEYPLTQVSANGAFKVIDTATGNTVFEGQPWETVSITIDSRGFTVLHQGRIQDGSPLQGPIRIEPVDPGTTLLRIPNITRKGNIPSYRGVIEIVRGYSSPKKLSAVNMLSLQDYLKAVVPNELPARYGLEAIRAQAVAARNYALRPREKAWPQFDICDSQYCQAYYGAQTETPETTQALAETEGQVALYDGDLVLALYSSAIGGWAEAYQNAFSDNDTKKFPGTAIPYLSGGPDLPYSRAENLAKEEDARYFWTHPVPSFDVDSPYYRWQRVWTRSQAEQVINAGLLDVSTDTFTMPFVSPLFKKGQTIGTLRHVTVTRRGVSGKAMTVVIEGSHGKWTIQKEFLIRRVFKQSGRLLPSANVVFSHLAGRKGILTGLKAEGGGFGHGVGMSQLGASWMGKHGYTFPQIIQHYYKGVSIGSIPITPSASAVQTTFYTSQPKGQLRITLPPGITNKPVLKIHLNSTVLAVDTTKKLSMDVGPYLRDHAINTLLLEPVDQPPSLLGMPLSNAGADTSHIHVWVELVPPEMTTALKAGRQH